MAITQALQDSLIYLDREFITRRYEVLSGQSPDTQITSGSGKKAGAGVSFFNAEISASETRSYKVSTLEMLGHTLHSLAEEPALDRTQFKRGMRSTVGWIEGAFSAVSSRPSKSDGTPDGDPQLHFCIDSGKTDGVSLITTPEYFSSGFDAFKGLNKSVLQYFGIDRVRALVRVISAQGARGDWVAIPYLILEP